MDYTGIQPGGPAIPKFVMKYHGVSCVNVICYHTLQLCIPIIVAIKGQNFQCASLLLQHLGGHVSYVVPGLVR